MPGWGIRGVDACPLAQTKPCRVLGDQKRRSRWTDGRFHEDRLDLGRVAPSGPASSCARPEGSDLLEADDPALDFGDLAF